MNTVKENAKVTMEHLQASTDSFGAVLKYGDKVIATRYLHLGKGRIGNDARVYALIEDPIPGWGKEARGFSECALKLEAEATELFEDAGTAIAWAIHHA